MDAGKTGCCQKDSARRGLNKLTGAQGPFRLKADLGKLVEIRHGRATVIRLLQVGSQTSSLVFLFTAERVFTSGACLMMHPSSPRAQGIAAPAPVAIPVGALLPWAVFGLLLSVLMLYFVGAEQGAVSLISGHEVHEFVHDGRHLLGFPCH